MAIAPKAVAAAPANTPLIGATRGQARPARKTRDRATIIDLTQAHAERFDVSIIGDDEAAMAAQLARADLFDALTELPNRTLFCDRLRQALNQAERYARMVALLIVALDGAPAIGVGSDDAEDLALRAVAQRIKLHTRRSDTVARLGPAELAVILPELHSGHNAGIVAGKILALLAGSVTVHGCNLPVSAAIGISLYPFDGAGLDAMLNGAATAVRYARQRGPNTYQFFKNLSPL